MFWQVALLAQTRAAGSDTTIDTIVIQDQGWPRTVELEEAILTFHQPQIFRWDNFTEMGCWLAVEIEPKNEQKPSLVGAAKIKAKTETDLDSRSVLIYDKKLEKVNFEGIDSAFVKKIEERFRSLQNSPEVISLDRMIPMVDESVFDFKGVATNTQPPAIFYSDDPNSLLVILDGKPIWTPTGVKNLQFAVNTNWPLFRQEKQESIYLLNETTWLKAEKVTSPILKADKLPKEFKKLAKEEGWEDLSRAIPLVKKEGPHPNVFFSDKPAELLLLFGPPKFKDIEGAGGLKSVTNTEADLFFDSTNDQYYFLVSGRWFRSSSLNGPWTFATTDLPETFTNIPEESEWGHVLSSVPGTLQAKEAALQTMIPQTAQLSRDAQPPKITYDGEPKFKQIDDSKVSYATNSQYDVLHYDDKYYLCYQGAWFVSSYPTHGWSVSTYIPPPIYTIPPTCPVYHVSYVHCYGYTSSYATYGYTSGYMGIHLSFGVPFYGTGYYYPPYYYPYGYPMYYGYPYSYGFRATYNPYTGTYGRQARVYGPYGGAGRGAYYNPSTGAYARGRSAWGPYGGVGEAAAYNPRTGTRAYGQTAQGYNEGATRVGAYNSRTGGYAGTRQEHDPYAQWGQSVVGHNDQWARTGHYTDENGTRYGFETSEGAKGAGFRGDDGQQGFVGTGKEGDLYVGNDGNVFKKEGDAWYQRDGGAWNAVSKDDLSPEQKSNVQERANNLTPEQKSNIQDRSGNLSADQRTNVQNRANDLSPQQRENIQNRQSQNNRGLGPQRSNVPEGRRNDVQNNRSTQLPSSRNYSSPSVPNRDYSNRQRGNQRSGNYNNYQRSRGAGTYGGRIRGRR